MKFKVYFDELTVIAAAGYWLARWQRKRHATRGRRRPKLCWPRKLCAARAGIRV